MASISDVVIKVLWAKSGNRCALCKLALTHVRADDEIPVGEMAHIAGEKPGSARYDASMPDERRNGYINLILLCPSCHTKIDKDEAGFTVIRLHAAKDEHENGVAEAVKAGTLEVTFFELEDTLRHLTNNDIEDMDETLQVIPPKDKIEKNMLSAKVEKMLQVGLLQSRQVEEYLNKNTDMDYAKKLRLSFVKSYQAIKDNTGDDKFFAMLDIASNGHAETKYMAAGLSVLAYYFQLCEVFEK